MYRVSKEFHFSAAHWLMNLPPEHPCSRLHGHNYIVILELESPVLNPAGFVKDYRELDSFKKYIDEQVDHRCLNEVFSFQPSAENLAKHFFYHARIELPALVAVRVKETEKTEATYTPAFDPNSPA
jgi:6-pyruvoyltetrahydropterin/6-carboxytetrahydropterin synthase